MKQVHLNRGAHEKLVPGSLNFVAPARRGVDCVDGSRIEVAVWCRMVGSLPIHPHCQWGRGLAR